MSPSLYQSRKLIARIKSLFRRSEVNAANDGKASVNGTTVAPADQFRFSGCVLDGVRRKLVGPDGKLLDLTTSELRLISAFVQNPHTAINRDDLMQLVYQREWTATDRSIDVLATKVRRKLEKPHRGRFAHSLSARFGLRTGYNFRNRLRQKNTPGPQEPGANFYFPPALKAEERLQHFGDHTRRLELTFRHNKAKTFLTRVCNWLMHQAIIRSLNITTLIAARSIGETTSQNHRHLISTMTMHRNFCAGCDP
jgi:DNA-binding winged helix-turn-helix (wHTH) protein